MSSINVVSQHFFEILSVFDGAVLWNSILLWEFLEWMLIFTSNFVPLFTTFLWMGCLLSTTSLMQKKLLYQVSELLQKIKPTIFRRLKGEISPEV